MTVSAGRGAILSATPPTTMPATGVAAAPPETWAEALERLEAHVDRAEGVIRGLITPDAERELPAWVAPTDLGPLPEHFVERARLLLERQEKLIATLLALLADPR